MTNKAGVVSQWQNYLKIDQDSRVIGQRQEAKP